MPRPESRIPLATLRGRDAFIDGVAIGECPYPPGTNAILWVAAWIHEEQESEESIHALIAQRGRIGA